MFLTNTFMKVSKASTEFNLSPLSWQRSNKKIEASSEVDCVYLTAVSTMGVALYSSI